MAQDKAPCVREKGKDKTEIEKIQGSLDAPWVQVFSHSQNVPRNNAFCPPLGLSVQVWKNLPVGVTTESQSS